MDPTYFLHRCDSCVNDSCDGFEHDFGVEEVANVSFGTYHYLVLPDTDSHSRHTGRSFATAAAMFMNSNSLPIAVMQSLVVTMPILRWGDGDSTESMLGRALTYLVIYSTLGMMVRSTAFVSHL